MPLLLAAAILAAGGCTSTTTGQVGSADSDSDADNDSDTDTDGDSDADTDSDGDPLPPAWFLMDSVRLGDGAEGCDLDGDDEVDNRLIAIADYMTEEGYLDEHPNDDAAAEIAAGELLELVGLSETHSLADDDSITTSLYEARLADPDAGVPEDLFGGYGDVVVENTAYTVIEDATIDAAHVATPGEDFTLEIPVDEVTTDVTIHQLFLSADIAPLPDEEMLGGGLTNGMICGAVDAGQLADWLTMKLDLEPAAQAVLAAYLLANADIECEDSACEQISFAILFSAVSVTATGP